MKPSSTKPQQGKAAQAKPQQAKAPQAKTAPRQNRRKHARVPVGLPVEVHISGLAQPLIVELMDIAPGGIRFRALTDQVTLDQRATFKFTAANHGECAAEGKVLRVQPGGVFIVALERANRVFRDFVLSLAA
ncbi:MAG TPA: PilZ domain-containing protein [Polyangia bacterium]